MKEYAPKYRNVNEVNLNLNENPFNPPSNIINFSNIEINKYQPNCIALISKIAKYCDLNSYNIFLGSGCDGLLHLVCDSLLEYNDKVILFSPYFHRTEKHILRLTKNLLIIPPKKDFSYNFKEIKKHNDSKLVFLSNPNNPTGLKTTHHEIISLIETLNNSIIVLDEALMNFNQLESFELAKKFPNVIILRSFSKNFGLASLRIGFGCSSKKIVEKINKNTSPFEVCYLSQIAARRILDETEYLSKYVIKISEGLKYLKTELDKLGLTYSNSSSSNILINTQELNKESDKIVKILNQKGIKVVDVNKSFPYLNNNYLIRVSVSTQENNEQFIKVIKDLKNCQEQY